MVFLSYPSDNVGKIFDHHNRDTKISLSLSSDLNRNVLLSHSEDFEVVNDGLFGLSACDFDAQVITSGLPREIDVNDVVKMAFADHLAAGHLHQYDGGGDVVFFWHL